MIQLKGVRMSFGAQLLYKDVELTIGERDRIGLVGPNGSGKTTLLKLIKGAFHPEEGRIERKRGISIAYLPQTKVVLKNRTVLEEALSVFTPIFDIAEEMRRLEKAMKRGGELDSILKRYAKLQEEYEKDGYTYEAKTKRILTRLGFSEKDFSKSTLTQSGGFQMRLALSKMLLEEPDIMLLDEPTNYLDIRSIEGFESYLRDFKGAFVLIAHDRRLLDECVEKIWSIENHRVVVYKGNYSFFSREYEERRIRLEKRHKEQKREIEKTKRFVQKFRAKAATARRAKSKEKALAKLERVELPKKHKVIHFKFKEAERIYGKVIELKGISKRFGNRTIFSDVNLIVGGSERIAIFGANGEGKTTLLKVISGELKPSRGEIWRSQKLKIGFYTQGAEEELDEGKTIFEAITAEAEGYTPSELRSILGGFLFSGEDIHKPISVLSGGERTRLAILKVLLSPANLLILDEPTNHLDIQSREILENAILSFHHTVIFAAHDRFMIDRLATKTLKVEAGRLTLYLGNYSYATKGRIESLRPIGTDYVKSESREARLLREKREKLQKLEVDYENAKANLDLQRARELWEEYKMVQRELERMEELSELSQDTEDSE